MTFFYGPAPFCFWHKIKLFSTVDGRRTVRVKRSPEKGRSGILQLLEPGLSRGGDGGCNICGGAGFFLGWLPLASSWRDGYPCPVNEPLDFGTYRARRVVELS